MKRPSRQESGTMLVYALMLLVVGAVILAGWIHVMAGRVTYTESARDAVKRRIVLENSRALASQYLLQNVLSGSFTSSVSGTVTATVQGWTSTDTNWGSFTLSSNNVVPLTSVNLPALGNAFSPGGNGGYIAVITGTLSDGSTTAGYSDFGWNFNVRSENPLLAFDLLTFHTPPSGNDIHISANLSTASNVTLWAPDSPNTYLLAAGSYLTPSFSPTTLASSAGGTLLESNFAFPPITTGVSFTGSSSTVNPGGSGAPYYASLLYKAGGPASRSPVDPDATSVFSGTAAMVNTATASSVNGVTSDGAGHLTIDLSNETLQKVYIVSNVTQITFQGYVSGGFMTADQLPTVLVAYAETGASTLSTIVLSGVNNRRLYLGVKKATNGTVSIQSAISGTWRLGATFENTQLSWQAGAGNTLQIKGGLRTDQTVSVTSGAVSIIRETAPLSLLVRYGDRNVWLETYAQ